MSILDKIGKELIFFDGALGTLLQIEAPDAKFPDELNIERPELLKNIHKKYIDAGANVITTNTFGSNDFKLAHCKYTVEEIIAAGVQNAKDVANGAYVALDVGPLGKMIEPLGKLTFDEAYAQFKKQVIAGEKAGCDFIIIETMSDIIEAKIAVLAAKENTNLPVICTMTFTEKGRTFTGVDPMTMVTVLEGLGVDALGINCSFGPDKLMPVVKEVVNYASIPIIVQPNAGLPVVIDQTVTYDVTKEHFAVYMKQMVDLGVSIVGGCCGTLPGHIKQCRKLLSNRKPNQQNKKTHTIATSSKNSVIFQDITIIGEALVPTGRKKYTEALEKGNHSFLSASAKEQKKLGAQIININVSTSGIDEKETMLRGVRKITSSVDIPLQIDSIYPQIIESALRYYPGKAVINSVNGKKDSMDQIFPMAKKYGACIIGMTFDEKGIPQSVAERVNIANKIVKTAQTYGIEKKNMIIDCLSLSAKAYQQSLLDTLEVIKEVKSTLGVKTMLGVANVSYGLPNRILLDRTYLAMALSYGLDVVMMSVYDQDMMDTIYAYNVLANKDVDAVHYSSKYATLKDNHSFHLNKPKKQLKIVLASVEGDTMNHGKNVLKEALETNGYTIEDMGLNIDKDKILRKYKEIGADIIALSAFAPSSLESLKATILYLKAEDATIKVMVGGASVKEEFANRIGADIYGKDAVDTLEKLRTLSIT